jgi:hypothetical protein
MARGRSIEELEDGITSTGDVKAHNLAAGKIITAGEKSR